MRCSGCGAENGSDQRFCIECGERLGRACPSCGEQVSPAQRFCGQCGERLNETAAVVRPGPDARVAERRVVSVLFADLVGFTPLSEARDAEEVRELLSRYFAVARTVIARYGGAVEKFIGDAVMAVWGAPAAREDDAERAVRSALDLVDAVAALGDELGVPGLAMRAGIVTGEVAVTLGATGEGMVAGDAVNTAARVQTVAAPGEVWVDEATRALTSAVVAYVDAGPHVLKGKRDPVPLFTARRVVAALGGAQRVDGLEAPFVGRDHEMRLVKELFHATLEEGRPRMVAVTGLPGVGKSRLGWELFKHLDGISDVVCWHRGRCLSYGDGVAFWALAEMVRSRLEILEGDEPAVVAEKLRAGLIRWVADTEERAWLMPRVATLLGVADVVGSTTPFAREDLFASWQLFFERLIDDGASGVVLLVEDLQWADDGLLDFLDHLLERSSAPIFVLVLSRPELAERRPGWGTGRRVTPVHLEPLGEAAMGALLDGLVEGLPAATRAALVAKAEGIPLYAVETVRSLIDRDVVVASGGRYVLAEDGARLVDVASLEAPTSLHTLLAARLDALNGSERHAVQNAAVLGLSFTRQALAALNASTGATDDVDDALSSLVRKEILALDSDPRSPERGQYRFVQAMVRTVAYETLARRDRKLRHLLAAQQLETEADAESFSAVIATHYLDARSLAPDDDDTDRLAMHAVELLERAAERAHQLGAPAQALKHYAAALELVDDPATVGRLASGASDSALAAGRSAEALELAERAMAAYEQAGLDIEGALALSRVAEAVLALGEGAELPDRLTPVIDALAGDPAATGALARLCYFVARGHFTGRSDARGSFPWWQRAIELSEAEEDWPTLTRSLSSYGAALISAGVPTMGLGVIRVALDVAQGHDLVQAQMSPLNNLASFLAGRDLESARGYVRAGLELARRTGNASVGTYLRNTAMLIDWVAGDWDDAVLLFESAPEAQGIYVMCVMYELAITVDRGVAIPEQARAAVDPASAPQVRAPGEAIRANALVAAGDLTAALPHALEALRLFHEFGGLDDDFPCFWSLALDVALRADAVHEARDALRLVTDSARGQLTPLVRALVPYFRARIGAATDADAALVDADFAAGAAALRSFGARFWLARCLLDHAEWLSGHGPVDAAGPLLDEAEQLFANLRAAPWLARATHARTLAMR